MAGSPARRRLATVLFVDIVGSTPLAQRIGPLPNLAVALAEAGRRFAP